jgi:hypothetical protein
VKLYVFFTKIKISKPSLKVMSVRLSDMLSVPIYFGEVVLKFGMVDSLKGVE